jgi:RNA polymerase sigma factor (sigma-70 family)
MQTPGNTPSTDPHPTRLSLIRRVQDRDEAAWGEFVGFYSGLLAGWARAAGCPAAGVPDVCQETLVCLLANLERFELRPQSGSLRAYLRTIVTARVRDAFRRSRRLVSEADLAAAGQGAGEAPSLERTAAEETGRELAGAEEDQVWLEALVAQALRAAFDKVETLTYKAFCLYVLEGVPAQEACRRLGVDRVGTLYQQKSRFLRLVRDEMVRLLAALDDPALQAAAAALRTPAAIGCIEAMAREQPDIRATQAVPGGTLGVRLAAVREALRAFPGLAAGDWLLGPAIEPPLRLRLDERQRWRLGSTEGDVTVAAKGVSGLHCTLEREGEDWTIRDAASRNGTWVDGRRIEAATLHSGDLVRVGEATLVFLRL